MNDLVADHLTHVCTNMFVSAPVCVSVSARGVWVAPRRVRGKAAVLPGGLSGEVCPPAVLPELGPELAAVARTEAQEQVTFHP